jgi:predicted nucleic acid-binding protein
MSRRDPRVLVLDASPLVHFARAGELGTLRDLVKDFTCVTTNAVIGELRRGAENYPIVGEAIHLDWVDVVSCDDLDVLYLFSQYMNRLGNFERNAGEASVLAWAEANSAQAYVDDQVACNVGRGRGVHVRRTLNLVVNAYRKGILTELAARDLVRNLVDVDAYFPPAACEDIFEWARLQDPPLL